MLAIFKLSLLSVLLPVATLAAHVGRDHAELARRVEGHMDLHGRQWGGDFLDASKLTYYDGETGNAYVLQARFFPNDSHHTAVLAATSLRTINLYVHVHEYTFFFANNTSQFVALTMAVC